VTTRMHAQARARELMGTAYPSNALELSPINDTLDLNSTVPITHTRVESD